MNLRITADLSLDLGTLTTGTTSEGSRVRLVAPPETPLITQLIAQLEERSIGKPSRRLTKKDEAKALTALTVRCGSWFAALVDPVLPPWAEAGKEEFSRIEQDEMARINIEASSALATMIEMKRHDPERYERVIRSALEALPLNGKYSRDFTNVSALVSLKYPEVRVLLPSLRAALRDASQLAEIEEHPTRLLANATILACWRNGPVEDIHSGEAIVCPIRRRRITDLEERGLIGTMWGRMAVAVEAMDYILADDGPSFADKITPLAVVSGVAATGWSLTAESWKVTLTGAEP